MFVIDQEELDIEYKIMRVANANGSITSEFIIQNNKKRILENKFHPLTKGQNKIKDLRSTLTSGGIPEDPVIFQRYLSQWRKNENRSIELSLDIWSQGESRSEGLNVNKMFRKNEEEKEVDSDEPAKSESYFERTIKSKYGSAFLILSGLLRLAPEEFWLKYPVTIEKVAYKAFSKEENGNYVFTVGGKVNRDNIREQTQKKLYDWLAAKGITLDEKEFGDYIRPYHNIDRLLQNGDNYHKLFGIEEEVKRWFEMQKNKLDQQLQDELTSYFSESPTTIAKKEEQKLSVKKTHLRSLEERGKKRLESAVNRLKGLNLILREGDSKE
jgi:hypothetical protein